MILIPVTICNFTARGCVIEKLSEQYRLFVSELVITTRQKFIKSVVKIMSRVNDKSSFLADVSESNIPSFNDHSIL